MRREKLRISFFMNDETAMPSSGPTNNSRKSNTLPWEEQENSGVSNRIAVENFPNTLSSLIIRFWEIGK